MEVEKGIYQELKCEIYFLKRKEKKNIKYTESVFYQVHNFRSC